MSVHAPCLHSGTGAVVVLVVLVPVALAAVVLVVLVPVALAAVVVIVFQ
jgi:hypothetical protein